VKIADPHPPKNLVPSLRWRIRLKPLSSGTKDGVSRGLQRNME